MANGHGGHRTPANPAPVSGPGKLSRRTDGGPMDSQPIRDLPSSRYGENAAYKAAESAAPMSAAGPDLSKLVQFGAPTQRPDEHIMAGMSGGPGGGPSVPTQAAPIDPQTAARIQSYLPVLIALASQDDADPNTRQLVRQVRADLG